MNELSNILPKHVALALQRAAQTPIPENDSLARINEIERVCANIRFDYPQYFKFEEE